MADSPWQHPSDKALVSLWEKNSDSDKAPVASGSVTLTPEFLAALEALMVDDRGQIKLEIALWTHDGGGSQPQLKGTIKVPQPKDKPSAPARRSGSAKRF